MRVAVSKGKLYRPVTLFRNQFDSIASSGGSSLIEGLKGYWRLYEVEGDRASADGVSNDAIEVNGTLSHAPSPLYRGVIFPPDNTNTHLSVSGIELVDTSYSITFWVRRESKPSSGQYQGIVNFWADPTAFISIYAWTGVTGNPNFYGIEADLTNGSGGFTSITEDWLGLGSWVFVRFSFNNDTNEASIILNEDIRYLTTTTVTHVVDTQSLPMVIGQTDPTWGHIAQDQTISGLGVWSKVLSDAEGWLLFNEGKGLDYPFNPQDHILWQMLAHYKLDEASGENRVDSHEIPEIFTLTEVNTVNQVNGVLNNAGQWVSGTSSELSNANNELSIGVCPFTFSLWFKPGTNVTKKPIISKWDGTIDEWWIGYNSSDNELSVHVNGESDIDIDVSESVTVDEWCLLTVTYDLVDLKLYVDGTLLDTTNIPNRDFLAGDSAFSLGYSTSAGSIDAEIDSFSFWLRALKGFEIELGLNPSSPNDYPFSFPSNDLTNNLLASYPFEEMIIDEGGVLGNDITVDQSGNGRHLGFGGNYGNIEYHEGKFGNGIFFPWGQTGYLRYYPKPFEFGGGDFCFSIWVRMTTVENRTIPLFSNFYYSTIDGYYALLNAKDGDDAYLLVVAKDGVPNVSVSADTDREISWTHVVFQRNGNNIEAYIDGLFMGDNPIPFDITPDLPIQFNPGFIHYGTSYFPQNVFFDDMNVWDRALTPQEIAFIFNGGRGIAYPFTAFTGLQEALQSSWNFSGDYKDSHGIVHLEYTQTNQSLTPLGKIGQGIVLDEGMVEGMPDPSHRFRTDDDFTISFWFKLDEFSDIVSLVGKYDDTPRECWKIEFNNNSKTVDFIYNSSGSPTSFDTTISSPATIKTNEWYQVTVTRDSSTVTIRVKGLDLDLSGTGTMSGAHYDNPRTPLVVGNDTVAGLTIDAVNIWKRALSTTEFDQLYNDFYGLEYPFDVTTNWLIDDLIYFFNLENNALDSTPNNHDGTLTGVDEYFSVGKNGVGLTLPGTSGSGEGIFLGNDADFFLGSDDFTFAFWWKCTDWVTPRSYIHAWLDGTLLIGMLHNASIPAEYFDFTVIFEDDSVGQTRPAFTPNVGQWYFVTAMRNGETFTLKIDLGDTLDSSFVSNKAVKTVGGANMYWGYDSLGNTGLGVYDNIGFWKRALTDLELSNLYNNGHGLDYPFTHTYTSIAQDLVYLYDYENNLYDSSVNGYHAFQVGSQTYASGKVHDAFYNPGPYGTPEGATLAHNNDLDLGSSDFTFAVWAKLETVIEGGVYPIVTKYDHEDWDNNGNDTLGYAIQILNITGVFTGVGLGLTDVGLTPVNYVCDFTPQADTWYFITITRKSNIITISVNMGDTASYVFAYSLTLNAAVDQALRFGFNDDGSIRSLHGLIDMNALWRRALSNQELTWLYNNGDGRTFSITDLYQGLIYFHNLENNALDSTWNNHDGVLVGNTTYDTGKIGNGLRLPNTTGGIEGLNLGRHADFSINGTDFTYTMWFKTDAWVDGSYYVLAHYGDSNPATTAFTLMVYNDQGAERLNLGIQFSDGDTSQFILEDITWMQPDTWFFVTFIRVNGILAISINNGELGQYYLPISKDFMDANPEMKYGSYDVTPLISPAMNMDSIGFWNRALSEQELRALYRYGDGLEFPLDPDYLLEDWYRSLTFDQENSSGHLISVGA